MSFLYLLIFLLIASSFLWNFNKTLLVYAPFKLILHSNIYLYDANFALNLDMAISSFAFILFLIKGNRIKGIPSYISYAFVLYCVSWFVYGLYPRFAPNAFFYEPITSILYVMMLFSSVYDKQSIKILLYSFIVVASILVIDALIDVIFGVNLITQITSSQGGGRYWISENDIQRAGMQRTTSFMPHSIAMGTLAALLWGMFVLVYSKFPQYIPSSKMTKFLLSTLPFCVLFANSRTSICVFICFFLLFLNFKQIFTKKSLGLLLIVICLFILFPQYLIWMYNSIFHESEVNVAGSTMDLRERQSDIAITYFFKNPILGNGIDFDLLRYEKKDDVMGMESLWFDLMYHRGLMGLIPYVVLMITGFYVMWRTNRWFTLFFFAWIISITMSSQVSISSFLFVFMIFLSYKIKIINDYEQRMQIIHNNSCI